MAEIRRFGCKHIGAENCGYRMSELDPAVSRHAARSLGKRILATARIIPTESEVGHSAETCRVRETADPTVRAHRGESHYPSVRDALARRNCTRAVHQRCPAAPAGRDNPFSPTLPSASISSYGINQALSRAGPDDPGDKFAHKTCTAKVSAFPCKYSSLVIWQTIVISRHLFT